METLSLQMAAVRLSNLLNHLKYIEDRCSDIDVKDNIQRHRIPISILRSLLWFLFIWDVSEEDQEQKFHVQLKHIVDAVQRISYWAFEHVEDGDASTTRISTELVTSNLEILNSLKEDIIQVATLRPPFGDDMDVSRSHVEVLISFMRTLLKDLKDISSMTCKAPERNILVPKELAEIEEKLKFLATFLWLISNKLPKSRDIVSSAQELAIKISYNLFLYFVDNELLASDHMKEDILRDLISKLHTLLIDLKQVCDDEFVSTRVRLSNDDPSMNKHVLDFVDYLILKLRELLNKKASFMVATVKIQIDILVDELRFFRNSLRDLLPIKDPIEPPESLKFSIEALIINTGFFIYFFPDKEGDEAVTMANYLSFGLPDLLVAVDTVYQKARALFYKNFPRLCQSKCPRANKLESIDFLTNKLQEVLDFNKAASFDRLKHQIVMVHEEMVNLRECFSEMAELLGNAQKEFLLTRFRDAVYIAECITDSFTVEEDLLWLQMLGLFVVIKDVKVLQEEVKSILSFTCVTHVHNNIAMAPSCGASHANVHPNNNAAMATNVEMQNKVDDADKLVVLEDATTRIIEQLTGGSRQLKILSIVGMPGLGKTTLAKSVYKHPSVDSYFNVRAWYCLSEVYHKMTLLSSILGQICQETNQYHGISVQDFAQNVYKNLKGRKYLIVLDDIWDVDSWNNLKQIFPDDMNGSRILFTTRSNAVAKQVGSLPYALRLLSYEESCELLWLKLFNQKICPQELSSISKLIASSCKGLPLAVVLVAGILKRTERKKDSWEQVAKTLIRSHILQKKILKIMEVCYNHLPDYLKPCFRYFGAFPKSTTISVSKMIRLWISEGFVQKPNHGQKSLKQVAESYLNDLIDRSLVMIAKKSSKGGVKACCVHDVLQEFCSVKLEKERSVMRKDMFGGIAALYGDFRMHKLNLMHIFSTAKMPHIRSLLYHNKSDINMDSMWGEDPSDLVQFSALAHCNRMCCSTEPVFTNFLPASRYACTDDPRISQRGDFDYGSILKYKHLGVLDLGNVQVQNSADTSDLVNIAKLICLKYLAVRVRTTEIPSEIGNLHNLETFHLSGAIGKVMLPEVIWKLVSLRNIIMDHSFFSFQYYSQEFFENSSQLYNMRSISTLSISHGNVEKFLRRLPNIQKLGCVFSNSWHGYYEVCNLFKILECLCELESLKMSFHARAPYPFKFCLPSNLKKLTMSKAHLPWDEISVVGQLPNLEVLKLLNKAFEGQQWDMREGEFQKLKFLKLDSLDIVKCNASSEHLPCLEQLVVLSCQQLEEIPSCFGEIPTLQLIEMKWCSLSAMDSVKRVLRDQRDLSNDQLNVILVGAQHHVV